MPSVIQTIRIRNRRLAREFKSPWSKLGLVGGLLVSLLAVSFALAGAWYYLDLAHDLPPIEIIPSLLEPPSGTLLQPTRLYDRTHGHVILTLENPAATGRQYLRVGIGNQAGVNQVSKSLVDATVAEIDPDFWRHAGYTIAGLYQGTHTTLAQLLISDLVLVNEPPSIRRNIRERMLAAQVTSKYGREKILEWYLNSAKYGKYLYGADAAARVYFGKSAANLSLAEAAILTAISEIPSEDPLASIAFLKQKQELIIQKMLLDGMITGNDMKSALGASLQFQSEYDQRELSSHFTNLVLTQVNTVIPLERLWRGGYEIITSLDYELQLQAECAMQQQLGRVQGSKEQPVTSDGMPCEAGRLLPTLNDSIQNQPGSINAEVILLDPHTGQILAMVGSMDAGGSIAQPAVHPAGMILSPFLYLTAFAQGMSPANLLWDIPPTTDNNLNGNVPDNLPKVVIYHGPVSLRSAFINDYAGAVNEVLQKVGLENVLQTVTQFGISVHDLGSANGSSLERITSSHITLLEGLQAYAVFASQGSMIGRSGIGSSPTTAQYELAPTSLLKVVGVDGKDWLDWTVPESHPILSPQISYLVTDVLSDENARWVRLGHPNALEIGRPAAVKISLNATSSDAWVVGYIPQLAVGVWMGSSQAGVNDIPPEVPAGLWHAIMQYAANQLPVEKFAIPGGVSQVEVCDPSGLLVSPVCPTVVQEVFLEGNEPREVDNLYQKLAIDRETGLLATIFTPKNLVEENVYFVVPPQAQAWAEEAGLLIPPKAYDNITTPSLTSEHAQLISPLMFEAIRGVITITGTAGGEDFSYYRLQVGQGLNPQQWLQIGADVNHPVMTDTLGSWDTVGLDGAYIVQLLVVKQDLRVDQAIVQVTVDNNPPHVEMIAPIEGQQYEYHPSDRILLNASVHENLGIDRVEFYIDGKLESTLIAPPYVVLWDALPGEHTLLVRAYDQAGNQGEARVSFEISK